MTGNPGSETSLNFYEIKLLYDNHFTMKISVIVKPNARRETVKLLPNGTLQLHVNAPPVEGRANEAAIRLMAHYYDVPPSAVSIVSGASSRRKRVEIAGK